MKTSKQGEKKTTTSIDSGWVDMLVSGYPFNYKGKKAEKLNNQWYIILNNK